MKQSEWQQIPNELWDAYSKKFPDSDWGMEGCGLSGGEAHKLLLKSVETGHDYLSESYPEYPPGVIIA